LGSIHARMELDAAAFFGGMVCVGVVMSSQEVGSNVGQLFSIVVWSQKQGNTILKGRSLRP
jgi:hypothetical protein